MSSESPITRVTPKAWSTIKSDPEGELMYYADHQREMKLLRGRERDRAADIIERVGDSSAGKMIQMIYADKERPEPPNEKPARQSLRHKRRPKPRIVTSGEAKEKP